MANQFEHLSNEELLEAQDEIVAFLRSGVDPSGRAAADLQLVEIHAELNRRGLPAKSPEDNAAPGDSKNEEA